MRTPSKAALKASALLLTTALGAAGPAPQPVAEVEHLDQNWREPLQRWFYHENQGTRALPMAWFLALEQPKLGPAEAPPLAAAENLARFGFLPDPVSQWNPHGLPVGFAEDKGADDRRPEEPAMGLTCAACHTGQVEYRGKKLRIDGGPAMVDLEAFQEELGKAVVTTSMIPERFDRFAGRVVPPSAPDPSVRRERLRAALDEQAARVLKEKELAAKLKLYPVAEGPGRLDALGRGGNIVFGEALRDPRNFAAADAPVSYPALWDTPWFQWAEYNGSISQPMARNVSEALGVRAEVRLSMDEETRYASSVRMERLYAMEAFLAGTDPESGGTGGLRSPPWPGPKPGLGDAWRIDEAGKRRGEALYGRLCAGCHDGRQGHSDLGRFETRLTMVDVRRIGTDDKAAANFAARTVHIPWEPGGPIPAAEALRKITNGVMSKWYGANGGDGERVVEPQQRWVMNGESDNEWRAPRQYRARPLNGIWATAPYLHNGSVPNLYELLLPAHRRSPVFHVGGREFDPRHVGFDASEAAGRFRFDTSLPGNSNRGHEFRDGPRGDGVIGPALSDEERWDLIEYLKTL